MSSTSAHPAKPNPSSAALKSASTSGHTHTTSSVTENVDLRLLKDRVEHLERERNTMSKQLHQREEKDRTRKLKLERYEKVRVCMCFPFCPSGLYVPQVCICISHCAACTY